MDKTLCTNIDNVLEQMIQTRAVLAPMAGITDPPFRIMARKFGCGFAFTEMIDVNGVAYGNRKSLKMIEKVPDEGPIGIQIAGQDVERIARVAKICEDKGYDVIDFNAACPARKVVKGGKGAALLKEPGKLAAIMGRIVRSVSVPVTVKIRSGWDENSMNYMEVAKAVAAEGVNAICVHTRTKEQMYRGKANPDIVNEIRSAVGIPVFASGNIFEPGDAAGILEKTGCEAVFIARGSLGRPWIFRQIKEVLAGAENVWSPGFEEIKEIAAEHFSLSADFFGEWMTKKRIYKHLCWYFKRYKNINEIMTEYLKVDTLKSFKEFLGRIYLEGNRVQLD